MHVTRDIIKLLERNAALGHHRGYVVFEDWLTMVEHTITMIPTHLRSLRESRQLAEDPPEVQVAWAKLRDRYDGPEPFQRFRDAFFLLLDSTVEADGTATDWRDTLGDIFQEFGHPNTWAGQFFTPWAIARLLAEMTQGGGAGEALVMERLKAAMERSPLAAAATITSLALDPKDTSQWFFSYILPAALPFYEPVTVCDPAVGSGVMLLAAASTYPSWMVHHGLVQFYGTDIDMTCVRMCRLNCILYGMNLHWVRWALELGPEDLEGLPPAHAQVYAEAQATHTGDPAATTAKVREQLALL